MSSSFGGSVASASAPSVSMIMLTQSNCTAVRGALPELTSRSTTISDIVTQRSYIRSLRSVTSVL
jgi:hypothetical protein